MDENHQDKTGSKLKATEDKLWLPPSSPEAQKRLKHLMEDTSKRLKESGYKVTEEYNDTGQLSKISREFPSKKTLWDWAQLLIVPLLIALLGITFTGAQYLASLQIANDQQQEAILKSYLDDISDLLLNHNLRESKPWDEVREVARTRTLTTLHQLDAKRNGIVLQFLQDAYLIGVQNAIIDLSSADLHNDDLSGANLSGANLSGAKLYYSNLRDADLRGADLRGADLRDAILRGADLSDANLRSADLRRADLSDANLRRADLRDANLSNANLSGADLHGAYLSDADLIAADLRRAKLSDAILWRAKLSGADLRDADLSGTYLIAANLRGAKLDKTILKGARYNTKEIVKIEYKIPPTEWPQEFDPKAAGAIEQNTFP